MKKVLISIFGVLIGVCFSFPIAATAQQDDQALGYRYRIAFEVKDEIGEMEVRVYTNTWIHTENSGVWIGNPHPDIISRGALNSVIVPGGCIMLVGRGIYITKRPGEIESGVLQHENLTIMHSVIVYDFIEKSLLKLDRSSCGK